MPKPEVLSTTRSARPKPVPRRERRLVKKKRRNRAQIVDSSERSPDRPHVTREKDLPGVIVGAAIGCRQSRDGQTRGRLFRSFAIFPPSHLRTSRLSPHHVLSKGCPAVAATAYVLIQSFREGTIGADNSLPVPVAVQQPYATQFAKMRVSPVALALGKGIQTRSVST